MLLAVVASLIYSSETKSDESTPGSAEVWNVLQLRVMVMVSLCLQTILILFGNRRKYKVSAKLQLFLWFIYLSADWIATIALGILSKNTRNPAIDPIIMAIWAPFLLLHLGGPDTITAYSLEDNELWPRHTLELLYQLVVAVYAVYRSWNGSPLNYVTIPVALAGIIKYGERTWSLWHGSSEGFRQSILPPPDPGPSYAKFMDDYDAKKAEGYNVTLGKVIESTTPTPIVLDHGGPVANDEIPNASALRDGFKFYRIPLSLFADFILGFQDHIEWPFADFFLSFRESVIRSQIFFQSTDWEHAFEVIAVELGLMYDTLYTKAVLTYSYHGIFLKLVSIFCTLSALITFSFLIYNDPAIKEHKYINYDVIITAVLFIGAIVLEIYAVIVLLSSSWAMHWMSNHKNWRVDFLYKSISWFQSCFQLSHTNMWSNRMSRFNLIRFCLKDEPIKCIKTQKLLRIYKFFEKSYYQKTEHVVPELKKLIFDQLKVKSGEAIDIEACKKLCAHKGDRVLDKWSCHVPDIYRSIKGVAFDQSILLWHIATDLCYYSDLDDPVAIQSRETSQLLSDYMLYLLVMCPFLLPNGIGEIRFEDTCAEFDELLKERKYISERNQVCKMILRVNTVIPPSEVKGERSKSVLFDACRLAKCLQSLETEEGWPKEHKWEMISHVWVEMLCHAASQCRGLHHAKRLSQGGELLTHVWLLMAHLGITEQFQISRGHAEKLKLS